MSGINPTYYNDITFLINLTTSFLGVLFTILVARVYPMRLTYCINAEVATTYMELMKGWVMHSSHMRTYGCKRRVSEIVRDMGLGREGEEEEEISGEAYAEIERIQNKVSEANKVSDHVARQLSVLILVVQLTFYIKIWNDLGFNYGFFDGLVLLSMRACMCDMAAVFKEWTAGERVREELDEAFEDLGGEELEKVRGEKKGERESGSKQASGERPASVRLAERAGWRSFE